MTDNITYLINAIPNLAPEIADFLACRLSWGVTYQINQHFFRSINLQLSKELLENTDPSKFLTGIGIRLAISPLAFTVSFPDTYRILEALHKTIRGVDVYEPCAIAVLRELALHVMEQPSQASKESTEFVKTWLEKLDIPPHICMATQYIWKYGERRISGASHEVAFGLVLPRKVQAD
ncbi:hypothetical protein EYZ11_013510 [Aspergillus tanneri]|uniref:Uncharacterized protein n=1 Tax=Aspergillus tanneri TaxID=1220188 RepID=A0A4S3IXK9_9EURO|nr:uncharacterized protein ATNIH1004_011801 [Aspergillus tanneri]KAA8641665.1 hypothetical protein ATNIH1004_011801 [Aspergillus tanneri]THC87043.1 hypothetical protein EYZ11_013510 [Aspergillus tanneri]